MLKLEHAGVRWFKLGVRSLLDGITGPRLPLMTHIVTRHLNLFLDLKLYDTRDTVERVARRAFLLGARFLTVYAAPSMLQAAMRAKGSGDQKVLAVKRLTDMYPTWPQEDLQLDVPWFQIADGLVLPVWATRHIHPRDLVTKVVVCPGIRRAEVFDSGTSTVGDFSSRWIDKPNNHANPATPAEAKAAGADYIVVGRPIICSLDPVAAAVAIMEDLK